MPTFNGSWPHVEIEENDTEIRVTAEVPGIDPDDIEVLLEDGTLTLRGESKSETEDKDRRFSERTYGRFERRLALRGLVPDVVARLRCPIGLDGLGGKHPGEIAVAIAAELIAVRAAVGEACRSVR